VVLDYETGRVLYVGKGRRAKTLMHLFNRLSTGQRKGIEAVAMDMWDPYIKAVKKNCRQPKSSLTCSTSWPPLPVSSTGCETASIEKPAKSTKRFIKAPGICCSKTGVTSGAEPTANSSEN